LIDIYIAGLQQFGPRQADQYHARLTGAFQHLAEFPELAPRRWELDPPVRLHPVGAHIVLYQEQANGSILIIRVRHRREDWLTDPGDMDV
jgi:toxin ParE1/3/4